MSEAVTDYKSDLVSIRNYLMFKKFPYHSASVIYRAQDLGLHVIFAGNVREKVTKEIQEYLKAFGFSYSFV